MKTSKIAVLSLLASSILLTGCQRADASSKSITVKATSYKKVYQIDKRINQPVVDYFVFYGENGRKYEVDADNVEYKYVSDKNNSNETKATVVKGDQNTAVITLPMSRDDGMR